MPYALPQAVPRPNSAPYSVFEDFLSPEECDRVIAIANALPLEIGYIGGNQSQGVVDPQKRASDIRWLHWNPDHEWLFSRLSGAIAGTNAKWFGYHLVGMNEALQLTHYKAAVPKSVLEDGEGHNKGEGLVAAVDAVNGHYDWHEDHGEGGDFSLRKLSFVIPLNEGYEGGQFRLLRHDVPEQKKGTMIVFSSFKTHCVMPVTRGERWSLVGWVTGPPFK